MAVKFGTDGTLYCNSIQRNWGVARNFIPYNCGNTPNNTSVQSYYYNGKNYLYNALTDQSVFDYTRTAYHFRFTGDRVIGHRIPSIIKGHKYYFGMWYKCSSTSCSIVVRNGGSDMWSLPHSATSTWTWTSKVFTATSAVSAGNYTISSGANWVIWAGSSVTMYFTRPILFDINECFNDTVSSTYTEDFWKTWIDATLREKRTIACGDPGQNYTNYQYIINNSLFNGSAMGVASNWSSTSPKPDAFAGNYTITDSTDVPWGFWRHCVTKSTSESFLYSYSNYGPDTSRYYYLSIYGRQESVIGCTNEFFISETGSNNLGSNPIIATTSKYGGCKNWRRSSVYAKPGATTSAKIRFDLNSPPASQNVYYTMGFYECGNYWIQKYNTAFGTILSQDSTGVNRYFMDCWSDPGYQPFVHCPSPEGEDQKIKFNTSYDVICNDIIIEPQISKIYFDRYGRIHCKALSPTVQSFV